MAEVRLTAAQAALTRSCLFRELAAAAEGLGVEASTPPRSPAKWSARTRWAAAGTF